jgi:cytochrome d ubiquinol oxidase subunit II
MEEYLGTIWFVLWGVLWAVYFMLDGFDLGVGMLLPFAARSDEERRTFYRAIGPYWDGNEVWLITAGGATFAAFPGTYAVMFSALYTPLMLILFMLILRGAAVAFRGEVENAAAKKLCDVTFFLSSLLATILLGVAFANIFQGVALTKDHMLKGGLAGLLNGYALLGGVLFLLLFLVHGALWLVVKSEGALHERAIGFARKLWYPLVVAAVAFLGYSAMKTSLFQNYLKYPFLTPIPVIAVIALLWEFKLMRGNEYGKAWGANCAVIVCAALFGVMGMYPVLLPSTVSPGWSMTIENSKSSTLTLSIMLGVALLMVPIVIAYQTWVYRLFRHKPGEKPAGEDVY